MATVHLVGARNEPALHGDERGDERTRFGEWLRRARQARGLTLEGITRQTRIPRRHLEAIEGGNLNGLPEFYQRAEVRAFARAVGVDEQLALSRLEMAVRPVEPPADVPRAQPARQRWRLYVPLALVSVVLASLLFAWALFGRPLTTGDVEDRRSTTNAPPAPPQALDDAGSQGSGVPSDDALAPATDTALAPAPVATVLVVTTQPPGARVTVNGVGWGVSPLVIRHLPPGNMRIRVSKEGYETAERVLAIDEGQSRAVTILLAMAGRTVGDTGPPEPASGP